LTTTILVMISNYKIPGLGCFQFAVGWNGWDFGIYNSRYAVISQ